MPLYGGGYSTSSWKCCKEDFIFLRGGGADLNLVEIQLIKIREYFLRMKTRGCLPGDSLDSRKKDDQVDMA